MITINLKGGLGNQMFQYACGRALSIRNNDKLQIVAEGLENANEVGDIYRPFSLQKFNIVGIVVPGTSISVWKKIKRKINSKIFRKFYVNFDPSVLHKKGNVFLDGYFQSEKYFLDVADILRNDLTLKDGFVGAAALVAAQIKGDSFAVSLHCRRGDYVTHPEFGGIADQAYYERAIGEIRKQIPQAHFYVFSDDISWCKENLPLPKNSVFVSKPEMKDYEELCLMSLCRHNIIANSSFSWWGAWLNDNPDKIVITPSRWSHTRDATDFRDIVSENWIRV